MDTSQSDNRKRKNTELGSHDEPALKKLKDNRKWTGSGLKLSFHGNIYQLKMLMLCLWRAIQCQYTSFRLASDLLEAEKFDDVVFQYRKNDEEKWKSRLLQVKHKEGSTPDEELSKITKTDLISTDDHNDFSLQKYFRSYLKIKQRSKENSIYSIFSDECEIEDIIVITNTSFENEQFIVSNFKPDEGAIEVDELLKVDRIKHKKTEIFKLQTTSTAVLMKQLKHIFTVTSDFYKLVEKLATYIIENKPIDRTSVFKEYDYPLVNEVFCMKQTSSRDKKSEHYQLHFKTEFLYGTEQSEGTLQFRKALLKEIVFRESYNNKELKFAGASQDFGVNELPTGDKLENLTKNLASVINGNKEIINYKEVGDLENDHVALLINPKTKKMYTTIKDTTFWSTLKKHTGRTLKQLKDHEFTLSSDFEENTLPIDNIEKLEILAEELASAINENTELTVFKFPNNHIALAKEVIDKNLKSFKKGFVQGEDNNKHIPPIFKLFRIILIDKIISDNDINLEKLDKIKIYFTKGFVDEFKTKVESDCNPKNTEIQELTNQLYNLMVKYEEKKIVYINAGEELKAFKKHISNVSKDVFIKKNNKVRFSTIFLLSNDLPEIVIELRNNLKEKLHDKFELISEYEFKIDTKNLQIFEEGALSKKLPILHNDEDVRNFFEKLKFVVNYPNRKKVDVLLEDEIKEKFQKLDGKAFNSMYQKDFLDWMADRIGTFYTVDKAKQLFNSIKENLSFWAVEGINKSYFADADGISKKYYVEFEEYNQLDLFLNNNEQQILNIVCYPLPLGRIRLVHTFQKLQKHNYSGLHKYTRDDGHIFLYSKQLLDEKYFLSVVLKGFGDQKKFNLMVIVCNTEKADSSLCRKLADTIKKNASKKIIFLTEKNDYPLIDELADNGHKCEKIQGQASFKNLTVSSKKEFLSNSIILQGKNILLNCLINKEDIVGEAESVIDSDTFVKIIKNQVISIGKRPEPISDWDKAYYEYNDNILVSNLVSNLFVVNNEGNHEIGQMHTDRIFLITSTKKIQTIKNILSKEIKKLPSTEETVNIDDLVGEINNIIINDSIFNDIAADKPVRILKIKDTNIVFDYFKQLCRNNPKKIVYWINWDNQLTWKYLYNPKFYFDRRFVYGDEKVIKNDIKNLLTNDSLEEYFIFNFQQKKNNKNKLREILCGQMDDKDEWSKIEDNIKKDKVMLLNTKRKAKETYNKLKTILKKDCNTEENKTNVYCLEVRKTSNQIVRHQGFGDRLDDRYTDREKSTKDLKEAEFSKKLENKKTIILIDEPGMGKSTTLYKLADEKQTKNWVFRINLKDCQNAINRLHPKSLPNKEKTVQFLLDTGNFDTNLVLIKNLLHYQLSSSKKIECPLLLLFDGFDEIKSDGRQDRDKVLKLLKFLKGKATVLITSRNIKITKTMISDFDLIDTKFQQFEEEEIKKIFSSFLMMHLSLFAKESVLNRHFGVSSTFLGNVLQHINQFLDNERDERDGFIRSPLQLYSCAEVLQNNIDKYMETTSFENAENCDKIVQGLEAISRDVDLSIIHKTIIDKSYDIYFKEKTGTTIDVGEYTKKIFTKALSKNNWVLAFVELLTENTYKHFFQESTIKYYSENLGETSRIGLIKLNDNNKFEFMHRTYAQYFVAEAVLGRFQKYYNKNEARPHLAKLLFHEDHKVVRRFFDKLRKQNPINESDIESLERFYRREVMISNYDNIDDSVDDDDIDHSVDSSTTDNNDDGNTTDNSSDEGSYL
ncbi:uncharacterized protein LOC126842596 [Adelges cooleyi]|uniref:uncharacterized protein LOC126842596 n=1 Tax=Adelges cooleyi TaxID=133065 RepID=UPI0021808956|nr:uncharacterized protein LOC126842596 [Adelges cooleyi]